MINLFERLVEDVRSRCRLMIGRAILMAINDSGAVQVVQAQLLDEETHDDMERIQEYGFDSVPLPGAEAVAVFVGGNRDHGLVIATEDRRYRLKGLEGGEVALYTDQGDSIILKRGNTVEINTNTLVVKASTKVRFETPLVETTGRIEADGDVRDSRSVGGGKTMAGMRTVYNTHTHNENNVPGGPTNTPNQSM